MKLNQPIIPAVIALLTLGCPALAAEPLTVYISSLDLSPIIQGWGEPQADKAVTGKPLSIGGQTFARGLGAILLHGLGLSRTQAERITAQAVESVLC